MLPHPLWLLCLVAIDVRAQSSSSSTTSLPSTSNSRSSSSESSTSSSSIARTYGADLESFLGTSSYSTLSSIPTSAFTGSGYTYLSVGSSQSTISSSSMSGNSSRGLSQSTVSQSTVAVTQLMGSSSTASNGTATRASSTSSAARPSNTVACNNYPEFCDRQYSNITEVCSHNSAFVVKNNAGSNQMLPIPDQLNDGVRMLQGETHLVNNTIYNCHTTCHLLNAGTWESELNIIGQWLADHPYDVVTFLIVNSDRVDVSHYVDPIQNSAVKPFIYTPTYVPQRRDQWPTLSEMILANQRFVIFMDYLANQTAVPYIMDEFTHIFETPFSPTNQSFPCTKERPPESWTSTEVANETFMYLANHNLNTAISLSALGFGSAGDTFLIPNTAELNVTNALGNEMGMLGAMADNCTQDWKRPPNFLLVDYYNIGSPYNGSVFGVAAEHNGVTYDRPCCGVTSGTPPTRVSLSALIVTVSVGLLLAW